MELTKRNRENSVILSITGATRLISQESSRLREELESIPVARDVRYVVDFNEVTSIDSTGLSALIGFYQKVMTKGADLVLAGLKSSVKITFELTRLHEVFSFSPDVDTAVS